jgi:hypothetical protein
MDFQFDFYGSYDDSGALPDSLRHNIQGDRYFGLGLELISKGT